MNRIGLKLAAIFLSLVICIGMIPVMAEEPQPDEEETGVITVSVFMEDTIGGRAYVENYYDVSEVLVEAGTVVKIIVAAKDGYQVTGSKVLYADGTVFFDEPYGEYEFTFVMPGTDVYVTAAFEELFVNPKPETEAEIPADQDPEIDEEIQEEADMDPAEEPVSQLLENTPGETTTEDDPEPESAQNLDVQDPEIPETEQALPETQEDPSGTGELQEEDAEESSEEETPAEPIPEVTTPEETSEIHDVTEEVEQETAEPGIEEIEPESIDPSEEEDLRLMGTEEPESEEESEAESSPVRTEEVKTASTSGTSFYVRVNSTAGEINFRSGAGLSYTDITTVPNGTILHITNMKYNSSDGYMWGYTYYEGTYGWVSLRKTDILTSGGYSVGTFYVEVNGSAGGVSLRQSASTSSTLLLEIENGTKLKITNLKYNSSEELFFGKTTYQGYTGWVSLRLTKVVSGGSTTTTKKTGFVKEDGKWRFYKNGKFLSSRTGIIKGTINGKTRWYYIKNGVYTKKTGVAKRSDGKTSKYYYVKKGIYTQSSGWKTFSGKKYYFNSKGVACRGWKTIGGNKYYFKKNGVMVTGKYTIGGTTYSFSSTGVFKKKITWKSEYKSFVMNKEYYTGSRFQRFSSGEVQMFLADISNDKIPELFVVDKTDGTIKGAVQYVYTYQDGKVKEIGQTRGYAMGYDPEKNYHGLFFERPTLETQHYYYVIIKNGTTVDQTLIYAMKNMQGELIYDEAKYRVAAKIYEQGNNTFPIYPYYSYNQISSMGWNAFTAKYGY